MTQEQAIATAAQYFPNYPAVNTFFITDDGQAFVERDKANMHARSLAVKDVYPVERGAEAATAEDSQEPPAEFDEVAVPEVKTETTNRKATGTRTGAGSKRKPPAP
jgi:hypothetical protein